MRGTVAKRIRRQVYGDYATQTQYDLKIHQRLLKLFTEGKYGKRAITVVTKGLRREYQAAKREYKMA